MPKIIIILPYFGKFDSLFIFWLQSCAYNNTIDFLVITDDKTKYNYPQNVKVVYDTFMRLREKIQSLYDFKVSLEAPYRFCNFKPAYGDIFQEYTIGYDFWGFSDCDMLFGDIMKFIPSDWSCYDKIGKFGHLSLIRNTEENRMLYKENDAYKIAFSTNRPLFFDEDAFPYLFEKHGKKIYPFPILDFMPRLKELKVLNDKLGNRMRVFTYEDGRIMRYSLHENKIVSNEYAYIHFLKRPIEIACNGIPQSFLIVPNQFINMEPITLELIVKHVGKGIFWAYWRNSFKWKNFKDRLYNRLWGNRADRNLIQCMRRKIDGAG